MARVFNNLLENAVKYGGIQGEVHVSVDREQDEGSEWAAVRVQDAGIGIPAADLPTVFDRYKRGANTTHIP